MSGFTKRMAGLMLALCMAVSAAVGYYSSALPDSFYISKGGSLDLGPALRAVFPEEQAAPAGTFKDNVEKCSIRLFGMIPVKKAEVITTEAPVLIPGGTPIGIKLLTDGVVVVSTNEKGPAAGAGIAAGDSIISANGETLSSSDRLAEIIMNSHGDELCLSVRRGSREFKTSLKPEFSDSDGTFKAGIWIKDSSACHRLVRSSRAPHLGQRKRKNSASWFGRGGRCHDNRLRQGLAGLPGRALRNVSDGSCRRKYKEKLRTGRLRNSELSGKPARADTHGVQGGDTPRFRKNSHDGRGKHARRVQR